MKKKSTSRTATSLATKREIAKLKKMSDAEVDFSDIPLQNPADPKWQKAVVGKFYKPMKEPIALRIDADVLDWLRSQGEGYQTRINNILRAAMLRKTP